VDNLDKEITLFKETVRRSPVQYLAKNECLVRKHLVESFVPLVDALLPKLSGLDELFFKAEKRLVFSDIEGLRYNYQKRQGGLGLSMAAYPESFKNWLKNHPPKANYSFELEYEWADFRENPNYGPSAHLVVSSLYHKYHVGYEFVLNGQSVNLLENPYSVQLCPGQIGEMVQTIVRQLLDVLRGLCPVGSTAGSPEGGP
jgi:hypothetical protein